MNKQTAAKYLITIINVCASTRGRVENCIDELDQLYKNLRNSISDLRKAASLVLLAGGFNAKVGKRSGNAHDQLYEFLRANKVITTSQSAFQKLYSTVTSLISSTDSWYENIDHKQLN